MDSSEKLKQLEEQFRTVSNEKETLEKQIAFHVDWVIPKLIRPGAELRADYIDTITNGKCKIAPKGEKELEKKGLVPWL